MLGSRRNLERHGVLGKLMVSSDDGDSWTQLADAPLHSSLVPNSLLARDSQGRFYLSPTTGVAPAIYVNDLGSSTWETLPMPPSPSIFKLDFDKQDRLLAATSAGLYRFESE